eukprot:12093593-Ditylum_brightwellii.AAC.1
MSFKIPDNISPIFFKQLLQDIEQSNWPYKKFTLSKALTVHLYGEKGSPQRKSFIEIVHLLKKRTPSSYKNNFDTYRVPPGIHILNLLSTINNTGDDDYVYFDDVDDKQQEVQKGCDDNDDTESIGEEPNSSFAKMSFKTKDAPRCTIQKHCLKSPPYKKMFASPVPTLHPSSQSN